MSLPGVTSNGGVTPHTTPQKYTSRAEMRQPARNRQDPVKRGGWVGLQVLPTKLAKLQRLLAVARSTGKITACPACPQRRNRNETLGGPSELSGSGIPVVVYTVRASRRGHGADVILARGSQYSTQPASASYTFSKKLKFRKKKKKSCMIFS